MQTTRVCLECGRVLGSASLRISHQAKWLHQSRILSSPSISSSIPLPASLSATPFRFIDIAVNLTDPTFRGLDRKGKQLHENDFDHVINRAKSQGVEKIIVSGTSLKASREAVALCKAHPGKNAFPTPFLIVAKGFLYCTVGCHPAESLEFQREGFSIKNYQEEKYVLEGVLEALLALAQNNRDVVVAIGEAGLDYTELKYCPKDIQVCGCILFCFVAVGFCLCFCLFVMSVNVCFNF